MLVHNGIKLDFNKPKKSQKIFKYMENEQHTAEEPMGD
jgi:hypothetical protein